MAASEVDAVLFQKNHESFQKYKIELHKVPQRRKKNVMVPSPGNSSIVFKFLAYSVCMCKFKLRYI